MPASSPEKVTAIKASLFQGQNLDPRLSSFGRDVAALVLDCHVATLLRAEQANQINPLRLGKRRIYTVEILRAFVEREQPVTTTD